MPTCKVCGLWIDDDEQICAECGARQQAIAVTKENPTNPSSTRPTRRSTFPRPNALECGCLTIVFALVVALFLPKVQGAREAARRSKCKSNLKEIGLALHAYHSTYGCFPPAYVADKAGRPIHSWRLLILPFLDEECRQLHAQYDFSEAWDGTANKKLLERRPAVFACPTRMRGACRQCTAYAAIYGPQCVFRGADPIGIEEITDGLSNTLLVADVTEADIPWTKPQDIDVTLHPKPGDRLGLSSDHVGGLQAVFADGSVRFVNNSISQATLNALFTRNGEDKPGDY